MREASLAPVMPLGDSAQLSVPCGCQKGLLAELGAASQVPD